MSLADVSRENGSPPPEVREAYEALLAGFSAFMGAVERANGVGIDVGAALGQALAGSMSAEEMSEVPVYLRMALGL